MPTLLPSCWDGRCRTGVRHLVRLMVVLTRSFSSETADTAVVPAFCHFNPWWSPLELFFPSFVFHPLDALASSSRRWSYSRLPRDASLEAKPKSPPFWKSDAWCYVVLGFIYVPIRIIEIDGLVSHPKKSYKSIQWFARWWRRRISQFIFTLRENIRPSTFAFKGSTCIPGSTLALIPSGDSKSTLSFMFKSTTMIQFDQRRRWYSHSLCMLSAAPSK